MLTDKNMRQFNAALLLITNPIRSRIPSIISAVIPHVERNLYVIVQSSNFQSVPSDKPVDAEEEKQRIRPMLHAIYKQLTTTENPSVDVLLHNVDARVGSSNPLRLPNVCQAVFADCPSYPGLYKYCQEHFRPLEQNFELRLIDGKESDDGSSTENVSTHENNLFRSKSTRQYDRGVLGGE